jgi:hypothetical protein
MLTAFTPPPTSQPATGKSAIGVAGKGGGNERRWIFGRPPQSRDGSVRSAGVSKESSWRVGSKGDRVLADHPASFERLMEQQSECDVPQALPMGNPMKMLLLSASSRTEQTQDAVLPGTTEGQFLQVLGLLRTTGATEELLSDAMDSAGEGLQEHFCPGDFEPNPAEAHATNRERGDDIDLDGGSAANEDRLSLETLARLGWSDPTSPTLISNGAEHNTVALVLEAVEQTRVSSEQVSSEHVSSEELPEAGASLHQDRSDRVTSGLSDSIAPKSLPSSLASEFETFSPASHVSPTELGEPMTSAGSSDLALQAPLMKESTEPAPSGTLAQGIERQASQAIQAPEHEAFSLSIVPRVPRVGPHAEGFFSSGGVSQSTAPNSEVSEIATLGVQQLASSQPSASLAANTTPQRVEANSKSEPVASPFSGPEDRAMGIPAKLTQDSGSKQNEAQHFADSHSSGSQGGHRDGSSATIREHPSQFELNQAASISVVPGEAGATATPEKESIASDGRWQPRVWETSWTEPPVARPSGAMRDIELRLPFDSQTVDVHLRERGGQLGISVRTADSALAKDMQAGLGDLVRNLESQGFEAAPDRLAQSLPDTGGGDQSRSQSDSSDMPGGQRHHNPRRHRNRSSAAAFRIEEVLRGTHS